MEVFKSFRLFGLWFYISSTRMKRRRTVDEKLRSQHSEMKRKKKLLYQWQDGRCQSCGGHFAPDALEIHHIVPLSENPNLALATSNMVLLCHSCHQQMHRPPRASCPHSCGHPLSPPEPGENEA